MKAFLFSRMYSQSFTCVEWMRSRHFGTQLLYFFSLQVKKTETAGRQGSKTNRRIRIVAKGARSDHTDSELFNCCSAAINLFVSLGFIYK